MPPLIRVLGPDLRRDDGFAWGDVAVGTQLHSNRHDLGTTRLWDTYWQCGPESVDPEATTAALPALPKRNRRLQPDQRHIIGEVCLLADHLDAALAAGEDLVALSAGAVRAQRSDGALPLSDGLRPLVAAAQALERTLIGRALQARSRCRALKGLEQPIGPALDAFAAATSVLADAAAEMADRDFADFDSGGDPYAYLRSRAIIKADAGIAPGAGHIVVTEDFLVGRQIPLGPLMDMTASALDLLDNAYCLFDDAPEDSRREVSRTEASRVAADDSSQ